jgi:hypothetical protein
MSPFSTEVRHEDVGILLATLVISGDHLLDGGGELREFPAQKDAGTAIANLGLVGWELVNVDANMWYFKREKLPDEIEPH